jgi:DNA polymerase-3 subunit delta
MAAVPPVVLLHGEETLLRDRRAHEFIERNRPAESVEYNLEVFHGPELDLDLVVASCETQPVFCEHRLVVVRNLDLKAAAAHAGFVAYLRRPNPTTRLLLTAGPAGERGGGKREKPPAARKAPARAALTVKDLLALIPERCEFSTLREEEALVFASQSARARGIELEAEALRQLIESVGVSASRLEDEIEKLSLHAGSRNRIGAADVGLLVRQTRSHTMFELTDAIAAGHREGMLRHLRALLEDGSDPLAVIGMVAWHFRRALRGAALVESGCSASDIARALGVQFRMQDRFRETCRRLGTRRAAEALRALRDADREVKLGAGDSRRALERLLLERMAPGTAGS